MSRNALMATPAPPEQSALQGAGASQNALGGPPNAAAGPSPGMPGGMPSAAPAMPAPSHKQTAAALRHFDAIEREVVSLLKDPDLGKTNMHSEIIDGVTRLVSGGYMTATQAVQQLGTVPDRPFDQKQWLFKQYMQTIQSKDAVLAHHGAAFAGQQMDDSAPDPDQHTQTMAGLNAHYAGLGTNNA